MEMHIVEQYKLLIFVKRLGHQENQKMDMRNGTLKIKKWRDGYWCQCPHKSWSLIYAYLLLMKFGVLSIDGDAYCRTRETPYICGKTRPPRESGDGYEKWYIENKKVKRWLFMSINHEALFTLTYRLWNLKCLIKSFLWWKRLIA